jgi:hypothetical protein
MPPTTTGVSIRLPSDEVGRAALVARVDGVSVNDVIHRALKQYLAALRDDAEFLARARSRLAPQIEIARVAP